jgi:diketogulonate reductase-like aldo/keto reductase
MADVRPRLLYGTAWKKAQTGRLVARAIEAGFRGIDTACQPRHYDEAAVGAAVAACSSPGLTRADLYLQTKFTPVAGQDAASIPYDPQAPLPEQVRQSCSVSLRNLRTSYLDCLLLHSPLANMRQTLAAWAAMESLVDAGACRSLGLSNCYDLHELRALHEAARIRPAVLQNRFHAETGYDRDIRAFCTQHGIVYQGFWILTANAHVLAHATISALASACRRSTAQILFRYLTQRDVVPLTGTRSDTHMREDLAIFEFQLAERDLEAIDALLQLRPPGG